LGISSSFVASCDVVHVCHLVGDGQTGSNTVSTDGEASTVLRRRAYPVSPTLGLRLERLVEVLGVNSRLWQPVLFATAMDDSRICSFLA
jgi:hypothetical protein